METIINKDIEHAVSLLNEGELVAVPTETVYGLAGIYDNENAIRTIFQVKNRPNYDPLILHSYSIDIIKDQIVEEFPPLAQKLAAKYWPGPLTLVLKKNNNISPLISAGLDTVAVRIPSHPLFLSLLEKINKPLAAPSANPFGYISPTSAEHVKDQLSGKISMILDGGNCSVGLESTIVKIEGDQLTILRAGGIDIEEFYEFDKNLEIKTSSSKPDAPGMLDKHYAPVKKMIYHENLEHSKLKNIGLIRFNSFDDRFPKSHQLLLSPEGNLSVAAKNLYAALRQMDKSNFDLITIEKLPETGLGRAMNDRISRAVTRK